MSLIEKLEAAREGSRELDIDIARAIGDPGVLDVDADETITRRSANFTGLHWEAPNCVGNVFVHRYTTSLDAALSLVPEGYCWQIKRGIECMAIVWSMEVDYDDHAPPVGYGPQGELPALALCIAALKARAIA